MLDSETLDFGISKGKIGHKKSRASHFENLSAQLPAFLFRLTNSYRIASNLDVNCASGTAPTDLSTTSPPFTKRTVGMLRTPN